MIVLPRIVTTACALLVASTPTYAANPFESISDFNTLVFSNATATGGATQGRLGVGGDFTASSYTVGANITTGITKNSLVVGGSLSADSTLGVLNGSTASGVGNFTGTQTQMISVAEYLSGLPNTGIKSYTSDSKTYTFIGSNTGLNVFNTTYSIWQSATNRVINAPIGSTVVLNILGASPLLSGKLTLNGVEATSVIFNCYQASNLKISNYTLRGSLLAPHATLNFNSGNIYGTSVIETLVQTGGTFYNSPFSGNIPMTGQTGTLTPEPSSIALLGIGLGLLPLLRKK